MIAIPSPELIRKYERPGPRYTSYPTAPEWTDAFGPQRFEERLDQADGQQGPLSIYVHLPFCREMCRFCGCNVIATRDQHRASEYLDVLEREVELAARRLHHRRTVSQLHWGGGTPTFLDEAQLQRCHDILARWFEFTPDGEKAIEIDPAVTTRGQIAVLARLGFNRISMGVQDFDHRVQETAGRIQGEQETADLVACARDVGFKGVNLDLMYGLPHQSLESWGRTLDRILAIHPDRTAVFGYAHVPWVKPHQKLLPEDALPATDLRVQLFLAAAERFGGAGYRQIGLDHFALESDELARAQDAGYLTRNFQGYSPRAAADTLAFGVSAISDIAGAYAQNAHRLPAWREAVLAGRFPTERGTVMTADDALRRFAINRVMCLFRLDLDEVAATFGAEARAALEGSMAPVPELVADGLVTFDGSLLRVTPMGQLLVRNVAMMFDAYLSKHAADQRSTFSRTV